MPNNNYNIGVIHCYFLKKSSAKVNQVYKLAKSSNVKKFSKIEPWTNHSSKVFKCKDWESSSSIVFIPPEFDIAFVLDFQLFLCCVPPIQFRPLVFYSLNFFSKYGLHLIIFCTPCSVLAVSPTEFHFSFVSLRFLLCSVSLSISTLART